MAQICSSPFAVFVAVTFVAQIPPIAFGILELGGFPNCQGSAWLLGAIIFGLVNIAAALYLAIRVINTEDETLRHLDTAAKRATYLLCHDPVIAFYILVALAFFAFLCVGSYWKLGGEIDADESCSGNVSSNVSMALGFGWFFVFGGPTALAMSMCCAWCDRRSYAPTTADSNVAGTAPYPDVENPNPQAHAETPNQYGSSKPGQKPQQNPTQPPIYTPQGVPVQPNEPEIPVAYAEAIPTNPEHPAPSAPQSEFDEKSPAGSSDSAAAAAAGTEQGESGSTGLGSKMGKTIGKLFKVDESKQKDLENKGKKVGEAVGKGITKASDFLKSQMDKSKTSQGGTNSNTDTMG